MKYVLCLFQILFITACATKKELVYIPTKCEADKPAKPTYKKNQTEADSIIEILQYTEKLEKIVDFCIGK